MDYGSGPSSHASHFLEALRDVSGTPAPGISAEAEAFKGDDSVLGEPSAFIGGKPILNAIRKHMEDGGVLSPEVARRLLSEARALVSKEDNVAQVVADQHPVIVVGDLHGQFGDLLQIMDMEGLPSENKTMVLLGDYVDRGDCGTDVILYLCACKILFPRRVVMLRGNHESAHMSQNYGFACECFIKYDTSLLTHFLTLFNALPLGCLILNTIQGDCFCCHAGIGPQTDTIQKIDSIDRFCEVPENGEMADLLWADPVPEMDEILRFSQRTGHSEVSREEWENLTFVPNTMRGCSWFYGKGAVQNFLRKNLLSCIIRGHQVPPNGFKFHFCEKIGQQMPVITLFSGPSGLGGEKSLGSFLRLTPGGFQVQQFYSSATD